MKDIFLKLMFNIYHEFVISYKKLHGLHNDSQFLPEKMKIQKLEKLVANLRNKTK